MVAALSVNLNAIALLRNRRDLPWPSVVGVGRIALDAGAHGLTVHPRPDQRHIRFADLSDLRNMIDDEFPGREFNMEGYPTAEFLALVEKNEPEQVTLVPDDPTQATSDHGWDFEGQRELLARTVGRLKEMDYRVSLFCDPDQDGKGLEIAKEIGADRIELYTGPYGSCHDNPSAAEACLGDLTRTASLAKRLGLGINAGHDLTVENVAPLAAALPMLAEVSIGHSLTADALVHGMAGTVDRFLTALSGH